MLLEEGILLGVEEGLRIGQAGKRQLLESEKLEAGIVDCRVL
jgi:hypothetical protein